MKKNKLIKYIWILLIIIVVSCDDNNVNNENNKISSIEAYKQVIKEVAISQSQGFGDVCNYYFLDDSSRENFLRYYVEKVRVLDPSIYDFIYDSTYLCIAHPILKDYIGKNHYDDKDSKGQFIAHIIQNTLWNYGQGFVDFYFYDPVSQKDEKKISYVINIKNTKYLLGIGLYEKITTGEIEKAELNKMIVQNCVSSTATGFAEVFANMIGNKAKQIEFIRKYCDSTRFLSDLSGYFFVDDIEGKSVSYPVRKDLEGTDLTIIPDSKGIYPVVEMLKVINNTGSGFVEYHLENPSTKIIQKKIVYVERIANTDFFIGCGYYE